MNKTVSGIYTYPLFTEDQLVKIRKIKYILLPTNSIKNDQLRETTVYQTSLYNNPFPDSISWLIPTLHKALFEFNTKIWKFSLSSETAAPLELNSYKAPNGHYDWHTDYTNNNFNSIKLIALVLLNSNFEGGQLLFMTNEGVAPAIAMNPGTFIIFPSFFLYRIQPVIKGTLDILKLAWTGPDFK